MIDVLIIGSGAGAANAAVPLVEAGLRVVMIDAGERDRVYTDLFPDRDFESLRRGDPRQHRYLLGDDFEGIPLGPVRVGAQLTPPRQYLLRRVEELLPVRSEEFQAFQTLALGGLAAGWGAAVPPFTDGDMAGWPIGRAALEPHYRRVGRRIGICGDPNDDLAGECADGEWLLPPVEPDSNARAIFERYHLRRLRFLHRGLRLGSPRLAICTEKVGDRGPFAYHDTEFWADSDRAVYRPAYTIADLSRRPNFEYAGGLLARSFAEREDGTVEVRGIRLDGGGEFLLAGASLVLGAGALGSGRLVLQSMGHGDARLPLVSNPYTYYPCLNLGALGWKHTDAPRHALTQVMGFLHPPEGDTLQAQIYSYRSLLTFKLMKETFLPMRESRRLMQALSWYFVVAGVHHADRPWRGTWLALEPGGQDGPAPARIHHHRRRSGERRRHEGEKLLRGLLLRLGCLPLGRIDPGPGASIHYGGTLPMTTRPRRYTTTPEGRLRGTRRVFVADGSTFPHLPAKGLTFTIMANADRVGERLARLLR